MCVSSHWKCDICISSHWTCHIFEIIDLTVFSLTSKDSALFYELAERQIELHGFTHYRQKTTDPFFAYFITHYQMVWLLTSVAWETSGR
jgi:hypothetical protein